MIRSGGETDCEPFRALREPGLLAAAVAAGLFVALASRVVEGDVPVVDRAIRDWVERVTPASLESVLMPLEIMGYPGAYLPLAMGWGWWMHRRGSRAGRTIAVAAWSGWLGHRAAKLAYTRKRPPGRPRRAQRRSGSYPSGHTVGATAMYAGAALALLRAGEISREQAVALGIGVPVATGVSRIALDRHWASDVAGGWLLGAGVALMCASLGGR